MSLNRPDAVSEPLRLRILRTLPFVIVAAFLMNFPAQVEQAIDQHPAQASTTSHNEETTARERGESSRGVDKRASDRIDISDYGSFVDNPTGSQVSYTRLSDDYHTGSATERFPRPALSLIKLYIAEYVFEHGTDVEKVEALDMIRTSNDDSALELYEAYPESITDVAKEYGLWSTRPSEEGWGYAVTSMYDVVKFVSELKRNDPNSKVLMAMKEAHDVAADGTSQNFGTAVLPGVVGTKWGWSDDFVLHSSVSFGDDFVVAAAVLGSADDLTDLVQHRVLPIMNEQP